MTSLSLIDEGSSLCHRLKQAEAEMDQMELYHFMP
eukprot:CAMPEP_0185613458 /NCGR_PEP_ID=MMETSP0436-20130131/27164_1 /TAXON_ID=626734 ORGANISM="Favella taraikaensis, Strain Fe Narragansett Bay" /NCGR_SAMPLE_ID=MMETSP0436 /ASSEMBLY_ACC=CAM_ASM_000390 /LENGTH=34 /DNA_ID= /DNA_START= /DNA_END= /DNA_ORIENTATION=